MGEFEGKCPGAFCFKEKDVECVVGFSMVLEDGGAGSTISAVILVKKPVSVVDVVDMKKERHGG